MLKYTLIFFLLLSPLHASQNIIITIPEKSGYGHPVGKKEYLYFKFTGHMKMQGKFTIRWLHPDDVDRKADLIELRFYPNPKYLKLLPGYGKKPFADSIQLVYKK